MNKLLLPPLLLFCLLPLFAFGQQIDTQNQDYSQEIITVFLDCRGCNESYIRTQIEFVNFVRNKQDADVHLLITRQFTGGGGREFEMKFLGNGRFDTRSDTLRYVSPESDTEDDQRRGLVKYIKTGLLHYVSLVTDLNNFDISYNQPEESIQTSAKQDKWNNWIFEISARTFFNGEETRESIHLSGGASARRITEDWKISLFYNRSYNRQKIEFGDRTDEFITENQRFNGLVVKSLSPHWSAGIFSEGRSSTRDNFDKSIGGTPAIEYNIFPYSEFTEREVSFQYGIMALYNDYTDSTIFNKTEEMLFQQRLRGNMQFTQPWGEIEGRVNAFAYLHDFSKNRLVLDLEFDIRVTRGLSINLSGRYSVINDQIFLSKAGATTEEELLNLRQRATSYSFRGSIGFEYTFGSIFNNVVNPRF